ncbi:MAG: flagellar basal-body MS-ring/collar protein FliF [Gammaproteobacteria bacterium]
MATNSLGTQLEGLSGLPVSRQISLMIVIAAAIATTVVVLSWMRQPAWQTLFTPQTDRESAQIVAALSRANIAYKIERGSGAIQIAAARHAEARMALAGQGIGGDSRGFEMMDEQGYGTSQALETARLQKATEGELERSINAMAGVASSRVHLAIARRTPFAKQQKMPTASVLVSALPGHRIDEVVAASIARLVAASVADLTPAKVTVLDHMGRVLTGTGVSEAMALSDSQLGFTQRIEDQLVRRVENILVPIVGFDGVRAQVSAQIDFTQVEEAAEEFDPNRKTVRSERSETRQTAAAAATGGVPGALSNSPPGTGALAGDTHGGNASNSNLVNYELDRTVRHTRRATGMVTRLSVAVLVDYLREAKGEPVPRSEEELQRIESLVREAVGFDAERGDSLSVTNIAFVQPEPAAVVEPPIWEQGWVPGVIKQVLGVVLLLAVVLVVLRPISRRLTEIPPPQATAGEMPGIPAEMVAPVSGEVPGISHVERARQLASGDPKRASQVVKDWIEQDG